MLPAKFIGPLQQNQSRKKDKRKKKRSNPQQPTQFRVVNVPAAIGTSVRTGAPRIKAIKTPKGCGFHVEHSELIASVLGSVDFATTKYALNPGLASVFPWLSSIANNFESYKFRSLKFRYIAGCPSSTIGSSFLSVDYDPTDPNPTSETQIVSWESTTNQPSWRDMTFNSAPANLNKRQTYYVRNGTLPANSDIDLYDVGNLFVSTQDNVAAAKLGKVWAVYSVDLMTPQLGTVGIGNALSGRFGGADDFATIPPLVGNVPLVASVAAGVLTFTASQQYQGLVSFVITGTGVVSTTLGGTATRSAGFQSANAGGTQLVGTADVNFILPGQTVTFDNTTTTVTDYDIRIGQYAVANA